MYSLKGKLKCDRVVMGDVSGVFIRNRVRMGGCQEENGMGRGGSNGCWEIMTHKREAVGRR